MTQRILSAKGVRRYRDGFIWYIYVELSAVANEAVVKNKETYGYTL